MKIFKMIKSENPVDWLNKKGVLAKAFRPININEVKVIDFKDNLVEVSKNFNKTSKRTPFENSGVMINGKIFTSRMLPRYSGKIKTIKDILQEGKIPEEYFLSDENLEAWETLKGAKSEKRITKTGFEYNFSEGAVAFPDDINKPSRTIITSEGGASPSRFRHVIKHNNKLRRLTPLELERLNMFPDDFTKFDGVTSSKRGFLMGNALVVGVVEKIGKSLLKTLSN